MLHDPALGGTPDGGLLKLGSGTLTLSAINTYTGPTVVSNGTLLILATVANANSGPGAITVLAGAALGGNAGIGGPVTINDGAALSPSFGIGSLAINNNLTLNSSSLLNFTLGSTSTKVVVSGNLNLGGILNVTNVSGFGANTYTLFAYSGTLSGNLPSIGAFPADFVGTISTNTPGQVNLLVQLPSPPAFSNVSLSPNGSLVLNASGGTADGSVYILTSTNLGSPLAQWTCLATNQFDSFGQFSFTNTINPNNSQAFYILQLP